MEERKQREARLAGLQPFLVDSTLVECLSSGYESLEDKVAAFQAIRRSGIENVVVASFVKDKTPDTQFLQELRSRQLIDARCWASTELFDANGSDLPGQDLPFGLAKMIQYGIQTAVLEADLAAPYINWSKYSIEDFCALVESRCRWVAANLYAGRPEPPAAWVRLRDCGAALQTAPERVLALADWLGRLEAGVRPAGLILQMPVGCLAGDVAAAVASVRAVTTAAGWAEGKVLLGMATAAAAPPAPAPATEAEAAVRVARVSGSGGGAAAVQMAAAASPLAGLASAAVWEGLGAGGSGVVGTVCPGEASPCLPSLLALSEALAGARTTTAGGGGGRTTATTVDGGGSGSYDAAKLREAAGQVAGARARAAEAALAAVLDDGEPVVADFAPAPLQPRPAGPAGSQRQPLIYGHA